MSLWSAKMSHKCSASFRLKWPVKKFHFHVLSCGKKGKWWQSMCLLGCDVRGGCGDWIWRRVGSDLAWHPVRPLSSSFQPSADGKWTPMKTLDSSASLKVESSTRKNCDIHRFRYTPNIPTTWHLCRCSKSDRLPLRRTPDTGHPLATKLFWPIVSEVNAASTWKRRQKNQGNKYW